MARSSREAYKPGYPVLPGQPLQMERPRANLLPVYNLIAHRRIRYTRAFALLVACSVLLSVTVSFLITTIIAKNVEVLAAKVHLNKLPFHGLVVFDEQKSLETFSKKVRFPGDMNRIEYAEVESNLGRLCLLGAGYELPDDTIQLLFPFESLGKSPKPEVSAWVDGNPSLKLEWPNMILPGTGQTYPALYGWALVNPTSISNLPNRRPGILLEFAEFYMFDPMNPAASPGVSKFFTGIENNAPEGARVITPYSGTISLKRATKGAFSSWQFISLIVLLSAAAAITCVLTVSFLGRKRSLGIFRVLGGTVTDLRRSMALEAAYIGLPGIALGVFAGHNLARLLETGSILPGSAYVIAIITGVLTLVAGVWMPLQLIKNANCDQLLNNRPVYVISNPSCANCGLCGGI